MLMLLKKEVELCKLQADIREQVSEEWGAGAWKGGMGGGMAYQCDIREQVSGRLRVGGEGREKCEGEGHQSVAVGSGCACKVWWAGRRGAGGRFDPLG